MFTGFSHEPNLLPVLRRFRNRVGTESLALYLAQTTPIKAESFEGIKKHPFTHDPVLDVMLLDRQNELVKTPLLARVPTPFWRKREYDLF